MSNNQKISNVVDKFIFLTALWIAIFVGIIFAISLLRCFNYKYKKSKTRYRNKSASKLPFIEMPNVYHIGSLISGNVNFYPRGHITNWNYEFGLFSVSLEPERWRHQVAGPGADIFEISLKDRDLRFLDVDAILISHREEIKDKGIEWQLIEIKTGIVTPTDRLYAALKLTYPSFTALTKRSDEEQYLQASLAIIASQDTDIDGLWWTDTLSGTMRTERGGIYQHKLTTVDQKKVSNVNNVLYKRLNHVSEILV